MVNFNDKQVAHPGIFVLFDGDGTVIKRIEKIPGQDIIVLISDNPIHSKYEVPISDLHVAGRCVWRAGRI
jgi:phage repressor protein C with HTH and peptisase S24 domain